MQLNLTFELTDDEVVRLQELALADKAELKTTKEV